MPQYRDPIHGYIYVSEEEQKIIDSPPFQRLRNIKQLSTTYLVYHGAEHTRFGHSIGVMHLVSRVFDAVTADNRHIFSNDYKENESKKKWYRQILRLIALTHDLGHAPFSHASEELFPFDPKSIGNSKRLKHEHYTEMIIKAEPISSFISEIEKKLNEEIKEEFDIESCDLYKITPDLLSEIYSGSFENCTGISIKDPDIVFLKVFMDSGLDCDKMDYLLRDSYYCGVTYGKYDLNRFISVLRLHRDKDTKKLDLLICSSGIQALEEFILARYFMFIQVYFHRTRRYFDKLLVDSLTELLSVDDKLDGTFPEDISEYLLWDDVKVLQEMKNSSNEANNTKTKQYLSRTHMTCVYESPAHSTEANTKLVKNIFNGLEEKFKDTIFLFDEVDAQAHKMLLPKQTGSSNDKNSIQVIDKNNGNISDVLKSSLILEGIIKNISICRIYTTINNDNKKEIEEFINSRRI